MINKIKTLVLERAYLVLPFFFIALSWIVQWQFGAFTLLGIPTHTIHFCLWVWFAAAIGVRHLADWLMIPIAWYYKHSLSEKQYAKLEDYVKENTPLGIILITIAEIVYMLSDVYTVPWDQRMPVVIVITMMVRGALFGVYLFHLLRLVVDILNIIELLLWPAISKTPSIQDDQLLKYAINAGKYITIAYVVYLWATLTFDFHIDWEKGWMVAAMIAAVGFSFRTLLYDVLSSVIIVVEQKFKLKDYIIVGSLTGKIIEIGIRHTTLKALDGALFTVPNSELTSNMVVNLSEKVYDGIAFDFAVKATNATEKLDSLQKAVVGFIKGSCSPVKDRDIAGNEARVKVSLKTIEHSLIIYEVSFAVAINRNGNAGSGKEKYWDSEANKAAVREKVLQFVITKAKELQVDF